MSQRRKNNQEYVSAVLNTCKNKVSGRLACGLIVSNL